MKIDKFEDFIAHQTLKDKLKAETFWKEYLHGFSNRTALLISNNLHMTSESDEYDKMSFELNIEETHNLQKFAKAHRLTVNTIVQGAWAKLLQVYSGDKDVVFGITVSGRPADLENVEERIGLFINTLPLRIKTETQQPVLKWLEAIQEQQTSLREYDYIPLVKIHALSSVPNNELLFTSLLAFENYPLSALKENRLIPFNIESIRTFEKTNYPLTIIAALTDNLKIEFSYNKSAYSINCIERMLVHFKEVLLNILKNAETPISELEILSSNERHQLLIEWNDTQKNYPKDKCIHQLFEEQVFKTPNNIAVFFDDEQITYKQLNERANQLSFFLKKKGVKPETLIGVCMERSIDMIIGLFAILKSGGAYVPIDSTYPQERISYILKDSNCSLLLTQNKLKSELSHIQNTELICTDDDALKEEISKEQITNLQCYSEVNNLAYIIYTSGSTGQPKGVAIEHRNAYVLIKWSQATYNLQEIEGMLASTSINFDMSVFEIFFTLSTGCSIILEKNILSVTDSLNKNRITFINTVPSGIKQLLSENSIPSSVKVINLGGEYLKQELVEEIYTFNSSLKVFDLYGPSEDTTFSTFALRKPNAKPNIGRPLDNTQMYILDSNKYVQPVGMPGELYIAGDGLARGYLNRSDLTLEKFLHNPFSNQPGSRMYKTGDIVRYLPDGNIEFIERIDDQVKIRGFRVELGEIEFTLNKLEEISACIILAKNDNAGNKRLVAYIVPSKDWANDKKQELNIDKIREELSRTLPSYMVPSLFIKLGSLPLTLNGKVNKKALSQVEDNVEKIQKYIVPQTKTEIKLAAIWSDILGIEKVGVLDNFFELGGHSLLAIQVISKINKTFESELSVPTLFQNQTIKDLARFLLSAQIQEWTPLVPMQIQGNMPPIYIVPGEVCDVTTIQPLSQYLGPKQPVFGFQYSGMDYGTTALSTVEAIASQNIAALKKTQPTGPYILGGYSFGGHIAFEMAKQLIENGDDIMNVFLFDVPSPDIYNRNKKNYEEGVMFFIDNMNEHYDIKINLTLENVKDISVQDFYKALEDAGKKYNQDQFLLDFDSFKRRVDTHNVHFWIEYTPIIQPYNFPITVFNAENGDQAEGAASGWTQYTSNSVKLIAVPGNHHSMMLEPNVRILAQNLKNELALLNPKSLEATNNCSVELEML